MIDRDDVRYFLAVARGGSVRAAAGRLGGDEFAVILAHTNDVAGRAKAARLTAMISRDPVTFEDYSFVVRASCGVRPIEPTSGPTTCWPTPPCSCASRRGRHGRNG